MNDIRRSILWVVFGLSMVLIWDKWQIHNGQQPTFFPSSAPAAAPAAGTGSSPVADASLPAATVAPGPTGTAAVGEAPGGAPTAVAQRHVVTTDVLKLTFNSEGGSLIGADLLQHAAATRSSKDQSVVPFTLLTQNGSSIYLAQTGLIGGNFPTHKTPMTLASGPVTLADGQDELQVRFESAEVGGVQLIKTYTLKRGQYDIAVQHEVRNNSGQSVSPQLYVQLVRDGSKLASDTPFYSTFTGPAVYTEESKFQKVEFADIEKNKASFAKNSSDGYVAMVQHYFATAWVLEAGVARENFARRIDNNLYAVGAITALPALEAGQSLSQQAVLFVGPQEEKVLETIAPGLELVKDYG
ncbi:MAG: membrane protein insertase YidC, partial [Hydrogenophaga sp.]|nr:membrane protein insertase YidC [Hydrogenophaga sp.]